MTTYAYILGGLSTAVLVWILMQPHVRWTDTHERWFQRLYRTCLVLGLAWVYVWAMWEGGDVRHANLPARPW